MMNPADFGAASAEIFLFCSGALILLLDASLGGRRTACLYPLTLLAVAVTALILVANLPVSGEAHLFFSGLYNHDHLAVVLQLFTCVSMALCLVYSRTYLSARGLARGEYYVLMLMATIGMMVQIAANSFLTIYLGLELMSLCLYALVALDRDSARSTEAAMKYFVLGALASGLLLYGMSMLYGATGSLQLDKVAAAIAGGQIDATVLVFGLVFVVAGLSFKLGVVPFHMWVPDVYHGAPNAMTLLIGSAPKIAALSMVIRLLIEGMPTLAPHWQQMLMLMAWASLAVGNLAAIAQTNLKRMLAYSTISQMGFVLLALLAGGTGVSGEAACCARDAYSGALFYTLTYVLTAMGAFGVMLLLTRKGFEAEELADWRGLNQRHPWHAFVMLLMMFSLAGIPPMVGFHAKLSVLQSLMQVGHTWTAVYAMLMSVVAAFYYLRVVKVMYFDAPADVLALEAPRDMRLMLAINGLLVLGLGLAPSSLMDLCLSTIAAFLGS
jgi:NADH-quinone oxidoreductase subunit N